MGESSGTTTIFADLAAVWTAVGTFIDDALKPSVQFLIGEPLFTAPLTIWISAKVVAQGKSLLRLGSGRRRG